MNLRELKPRGEPDKYIERPTLDEDSQRSVAGLWETHAGLTVQPRREPWGRWGGMAKSIGNAVRSVIGPRGPSGRDGADGAQGPAGADGSSALPSGVIVMSHLLSLGAGWQLCDGTNGTPDLRDKFIVSAGNGYAIGDTGGTSSYTTNQHIIAHDHTTELILGAVLAAGTAYDIKTPTSFPTYPGLDPYSSGHYFDHAFYAAPSGPTTINGFDNRPPYHALYFHMKL